MNSNQDHKYKLEKYLIKQFYNKKECHNIIINTILNNSNIQDKNKEKEYIEKLQKTIYKNNCKILYK